MNPREHLADLQRASLDRATALKRKLRLFTFLRIVIFASAVALVYALWSNTPAALGAAAAGIALFLVVVKRHVSATGLLALELAYHDLCADERAMAEGHWRTRPDGAPYGSASHPFVSDLNIFGKHSLFQFFNRTQRPSAEQILARWLGENLTNRADIIAERDTIAHFSSDPHWSLSYLAHARTAPNSEARPLADHSLWTKPIPGPSGKLLRILLTRVAPALVLLATALYAADAMTWNAYLVTLLASGALTSAFLKRHQPLFHTWTALTSGLQAYASMLDMMRSRDFGGSPFREKLLAASLPDSEKALNDLQRIAGAIDSRNNLVVGIGLNALLFWDFQCAYRLRDWQQRYGHHMQGWLHLVSEVEAYQSFALYRFGHPEAVDVEWTDAPGIFCESATHPLLGQGAVPNPIHLAGEAQFAIITGANMAGKSTYLRTVGVLAAMAMRGLPVTAASMRMAPMRLYTSMLTTDSLGDHASYFFSELTRLRAIVDALDSRQPHLIILDEILKGTNSVDKAEGSKLFLQKLLGLSDVGQTPWVKGLIATHDLSLCTMADAYPGRVVNLSFEAGFASGKLTFDYTLREGVCQNMNASFLLKEMGLT